MNTVKTIALLSTIVLASFSLEVEAKMGHRAEVNMLLSGKTAAYLELTDTQKASLRTMIASHKEAMQQLRSEGNTIDKSELKALVQAEQFDKAQAQIILEKQAPKKQQIALARLELRHQVYQLLSEEQREKMQALKKRRHRK